MLRKSTLVMLALYFVIGMLIGSTAGQLFAMAQDSVASSTPVVTQTDNGLSGTLAVIIGAVLTIISAVASWISAHRGAKSGVAAGAAEMRAARGYEGENPPSSRR